VREVVLTVITFSADDLGRGTTGRGDG
jgi:hypothetical protein